MTMVNEREIELAHFDGKARAEDDVNFGTDTKCPHPKGSVMAKWWIYGYAEETNIQIVHRHFLALRAKLNIRKPIAWSEMKKIGWKELRAINKVLDGKH